MKTDSERQIEYQKRRAASEVRITFWAPKKTAAIDKARRDRSTSEWINAIITNALDKK